MRLFEVAFSFPRLDMKREKWKFQNKKIKINVFELVSLLYYFHTTSCFKALFIEEKNDSITELSYGT